jgi:NADPH:quinone reductase-like Zn-dependent oxidoreductase
MSIPATMRALQQTSLNGPQDMRLITDVPVPSPGEGEVLIRVTAAGVNFADISKAHGTFLDGPRPPYLAGFEAAGEIVAVGEAVSGSQPGARSRGWNRCRTHGSPRPPTIRPRWWSNASRCGWRSSPACSTCPPASA